MRKYRRAYSVIFLIFSIKNAFRGKIRFILTLILLIIGITALGASLGAYYFSEDSLKSSSGDNGGMNLVIVHNQSLSNDKYSLSQLNQVKSTEGVKDAVGVSAFPIFLGDYKEHEKNGNFTQGVWYAFVGESLRNNSDVPGIGHIKLIEGKLPSEGTQEVLITKRFAERVGLNVGDPLNVTALNFYSNEDITQHQLDPTKSKFSVAGIISNLPCADGIMDLKVANELSYNGSTSKFDYMYIKADLNQINQTKNILSQQNSSYDVEFYENINSQSINLFTYMIIFLIGLGTVIMLITSLKSISERTKEIGVLKAIGWTNKRVMAMIFIETITQAMIAWMISITILVMFAATESNLGLLTFFQTNSTSLIYVVSLTLILTLIMPILGSILPLVHVAHLEPMEALRYE